MKFTLLVLLVIVSARAGELRQSVPLADHHQHLFSPASSSISSAKPIDAAALVSMLDDAGIRKAAVLSVAYLFGKPRKGFENEYEALKAENDWTAQQVARFPDRLRGFCSVNPLKDYALEELARCAKNLHLRHGLKLHFGNSAVDLSNPEHVAKLHRVFRAANDFRMPIVVHLRASISQKLPYGRDEARTFLNEIVPAAPDVMIQIADLCGAGGYNDPLVEEAVGVFVEAIEKGDPRTKNLWFDVTSVATPFMMAGTESANARAAVVATRIRQLRVNRVLYGSDAGTMPKDGWEVFRKLPLSEAEFLTIANNVPPYMR